MKKILLTTIFMVIASNCFGAPIHDAIIKGDLNKVKELIKKDKKNNIEATDSSYNTPLYTAIRNAIYSKGTGEVVELQILDIGYENVPISTYLDIITYLVRRGANVEVTRMGNTPLYELVLSENTKYGDNNFKNNIFKIIKYLVEKGKAKITDEMIVQASNRVKKYLKNEKKKREKMRKNDFETRTEFLLEEEKMRKI